MGHPVDGADTDQLAGQLAALAVALDEGDLAAARSLLERARTVLVAGIDDDSSGANHPVVFLTDRERATLRRLTDGALSQKDIARELNVSRNTVKTHLKSLYLKLGAHCRGEAIQRARELGVLPQAA